MFPQKKIANTFSNKDLATLYTGSCMDFLPTVPDESVQLVVTSPPYNIGKEYEKKISIEKYIEQQEEIITQCVRVLKPQGSICWQVGNHVKNGEIFPLDIILYPIFTKLGLKLRNRIVWHFEHGLHCSKRFSGRYETIMWYSKEDNYTFNLDPVRVPQKYPNKKHFKGPKAGQLSCNPLGKNPGDLWVIPNVKNNHVEKTIHPCQFPVELIERLVLSMTNEGDIVLDPFVGVGSSIIASVLNNRIGIGSEIMDEYVEIARKRINEAFKGTIKIRPMNTPVYDPDNPPKVKTEYKIIDYDQKMLFEKNKKYKKASNENY